LRIEISRNRRSDKLLQGKISRQSSVAIDATTATCVQTYYMQWTKLSYANRPVLCAYYD